VKHLEKIVHVLAVSKVLIASSFSDLCNFGTEGDTIKERIKLKDLLEI